MTKRDKYFGQGMICNCGNCESATRRAIAITGKMLLDKECSQYISAVGSALVLVSARMMDASLQKIFEDGGIPEGVARMMSSQQAHGELDEIGDMITKEFFGGNHDGYIAEINEKLKAANEAYAKETELPKGD